MAIALEVFANGETGYVAKMNANSATIEAAINALAEALVGGSGGGVTGEVSVGALFSGLFGGVTGLIGAGSYKPTINGTSLVVAAGACYRAEYNTVVQSVAQVSVAFAGQLAGTYYIVPDLLGAPTRSSSSTGAVYSVVWGGSSFGAITRVAAALGTADEDDDARDSTAMGMPYESLDQRLEALEEYAGNTDAVVAGLAAVVKTRKVGITIDGAGTVISAGVKGAIQVDFRGTIVGWSAIADQAGEIEIDVAVARESPVAAPPIDPPIPDEVIDKITASAPIVLTGPSGAQSASAGVSEVATWDTAIEQYDVIQFNVVAATTVTRVSLYISIEEN